MWVESLFDDFKRRCVCHDVCCPTNTYPSEDQHHYQRKQKLKCQRQQIFTNCQFVKVHMKKDSCKFNEEEKLGVLFQYKNLCWSTINFL